MAVRCRIEDIINERGLKKKYIYEQLGMDSSYFSRISKGKVVPNIETLYRIAKFFDCHIEDLYDFTDVD